MKLPLPELLDELVYSMYRKVLWTDHRRYCTFAPAFGGSGRFNVRCDLAVDGFARSGNTFVADMLRATQRPDFTLESHHHIPPFVMAACEHGTPTVLLIREPVDSVISLSLHSQWSLRKSLDHYIAYHACLRPYQSRVMIARFADFTWDFRRLVLDINQRFGLSLKTDFDHGTVSARTLAAMDRRLSTTGKPLTPLQIHRPTEERRHLKIKLLQQLRHETLAQRLFEAERLYAEYSAASILVPRPGEAGNDGQDRFQPRIASAA